MAAEAKRVRDVRVSDVEDSESILIVVTLSHLFVLDLKGNRLGSKRARDEPSTGPRNQPVVLKLINFESNGLPENMGVMRLGNNRVVMFGGEVNVEGVIPGRDTTVFYKLNPDNDWSVELTKEVSEPMAPKTLPWVEEVNGKVYVLQDSSLFEVYDIALNTWNEVPKIPTQESWSTKEKAIVESGSLSDALLVGCRIYIRFARRGKHIIFGCFNTSTYEWEEKNAFNLQECFQNTFVPFPDSGMCVSRIDDHLDDGLNLILLHHNTTMIAYLIDDSGYLLCYQLIYDLSSEDNMGVSLVDINGRGRICLVISDVSDDDDDVYVILIRHFELKLKEDFKEQVKKIQADASADGDAIPVQMKFLTVRNIKEQRCTHTEEDVFIGFRDAFFL